MKQWDEIRREEIASLNLKLIPKKAKLDKLLELRISQQRSDLKSKKNKYLSMLTTIKKESNKIDEIIKNTKNDSIVLNLPNLERDDQMIKEYKE